MYINYIDSVNVETDNYQLLGFSPVITCDTAESEMVKDIELPQGFILNNLSNNENCYISFNVYFKNGCATTTEPSNKMTLGNSTFGYKKVYVNRFGTLTEIKYHEITEYDANENATTTYTTLQKNITLELYYDNTLNNGNGGFVVVGNPKVFSSHYNTIFADGSKGKTMKRILTTDISSSSSSTEYNLNTGEKFTDWDFIMPIVKFITDTNHFDTSMYPKPEIEYCISLSSGTKQNEFFSSCNSYPDTDRRIAWGCTSDTTFKVGHVAGATHLLGFYGIKFGTLSTI